MPRKLPAPTERVSWRIEAEDLDLLRAVYGEGRVTDAVRDLVHVYCGRLRERLARANPDQGARDSI